MISLSVKAVDGGTSKYGKSVSDLQTGITIEGTSISGTLKYVTDYTEAFSGDEATGNFLVLETEVPEDATVTTELIGGTKGPVDMTDDKYCVYRITNKDTQQVKFTVAKGVESKEAIYDLKGLTLNGAG